MTNSMLGKLQLRWLSCTKVNWRLSTNSPSPCFKTGRSYHGNNVVTTWFDIFLFGYTFSECFSLYNRGKTPNYRRFFIWLFALFPAHFMNRIQSPVIIFMDVFSIYLDQECRRTRRVPVVCHI